MEGIIRAYQKLLIGWSFEKSDAQNQESLTLPEAFAQSRFLKKMELPDPRRAKARKAEAFAAYMQYDEDLAIPGRAVPDGDPWKGFLPSTWYRARNRIHKWCGHFKLANAVFTNGSETHTTKGFNSIESKLSRSVWACPDNAFEWWAETAYQNRALKRATRSRFQKAMARLGLSIHAFHRESWEMYKHHERSSYLCFRRMLRAVTAETSCNRFSTVRKNNEKDRSICLEPFPVMLLQRRIGIGLRRLLREQADIDLRTLAETHRKRIACSDVATLDMSNASDSITKELVAFLFPRWFYDLLMDCRCPEMLGLDGELYSLNKIASMGNGYCFELMSTVILAIILEHDDRGTVFGDDIIVSNSAAKPLIADLVAAGFVVNEEKSFVDSEFRESCGAVYYEPSGYIRSFDFEYPESIGDCHILANKAFLLGREYGSFLLLWQEMMRLTPSALRGPVNDRLAGSAGNGGGPDRNVGLSGYFWDPKASGGLSVSPTIVRDALNDLQLGPSWVCYGPKPAHRVRFFTGFQLVDRLASPTLTVLHPKTNLCKYLMYLHGGRKVKDTRTGQGIWQPVTYVAIGQRAFRLKSLVASRKRSVAAVTEPTPTIGVPPGRCGRETT